MNIRQYYAVVSYAWKRSVDPCILRVIADACYGTSILSELPDSLYPEVMAWIDESVNVRCDRQMRGAW
jgi:hypothetical protein